MTDGDMVELVARALHAHEWKGQPSAEPFHVAKTYWEDCARAAIRAMEEPTEEMISAAMKYLRMDSRTNAWAAYHAMCRTALGEEKSGE